MKVKLLVDVSYTKAGEIVDAIFANLNTSKWGYFFEGSSLMTIHENQYEIVKVDLEKAICRILDAVSYHCEGGNVHHTDVLYEKLDEIRGDL